MVRLATACTRAHVLTLYCSRLIGPDGLHVAEVAERHVPGLWRRG